MSLRAKPENVKLKEITTPEVRALQRSQLSESELAALDGIKQRAHRWRQ